MTENTENEDYTPPNRGGYYMQLLTLLGICFVSMFVGQILAIGLASIVGIKDLSVALSEVQQGNFPALLNPLRFLLSIMHGFTFLVPALVFAYIYWKPLKNSLYLHRLPTLSGFAWAALAVVAAMPLVIVMHYFNTLIPADIQQQAGRELQMAMLRMDSPTDLFFTFLLVGIMAGVGEELLFRGVLQRIFALRFANIHLAVLFSGILFSLVHFELQAFVPRLFLSMVFGYVFYWSGSLYTSIALHLLYNGLQVFAVYANPEMSAATPTPPEMPMYFIALGGALVLGFAALRLHKAQSNSERETYLLPPSSTP